MSTLSPSRRFHSTAYHLSRKQSYTQHRQHHAQNMNQANISQYSPSIHSPKLKQESEHTKLHNNSGLIEELKNKLETVLKHNSHLLNENAMLSEMVNNLKIELEARSRKEEALLAQKGEVLKIQIARVGMEYERIITQIRQQVKIKDGQIDRLMQEISRLHDDCYKVELVKNGELKEIAEAHERQLTMQIRNIKKSTQDSRQIMELQVKKLKESLQLKSFELESARSVAKSECEKLSSEVVELRTQLAHSKLLKELEIRQLAEKHQQSLISTSKNTQREHILSTTRLENRIKKIKQQLVNKTIEIEQVQKKSTMHSQQHQLEVQNIRQDRERLLQEIRELQTTSKENLYKEREKFKSISELELKNYENIVDNQKECFRSEINKLMIVCASKTDEIKKLYNMIHDMKDTHAAEKKDTERLVETLRKRIKTLQEDSLEELELLKIKIAHLHEADVKGLEQYYQSEIAILMKQIKQLQDQRDIDRQKIHKCLQENDMLRKNFDTELTKYKAKIQDYKVKFAAAHLQFREQITSLGTKMELTSQTLLRETQQKQKGAEFFEAEKKKFHALILGKDKQISTIHETMSKLKQLHGDEVKQLRDELSMTRDNFASKMTEMKNLKKEYEQEFERKSQKIIQERHESPNEALLKQSKELRNKIDIIEKELFQKSKQIEFMQRENKSLQQEVGLRAGFLQTMQLESSAAIEDERSKMKILMNENEVAMKDYYETKLATKGKDIASLQEQLQEKQSDIRQLIVKYNQLEKRLKELLDSQERLSELEKKIVNLGLDQNLVKNMSQLFSKYRA